MEIKEFVNANCEEYVLDAIKNRKEIAYTGITDDKLVLCCNKEFTNIEYCEKNGIRIFYLPNMGSTIVVSAGDVEIGYFKKHDDTYSSDFADSMIKLLGSKGVSATFDGNDILVDGKYKVCGIAKNNINNICYTGIHISMTVDNELINNICMKPRTKIPKGLADYGFTSEQILQFVNDITAKY